MHARSGSIAWPARGASARRLVAALADACPRCRDGLHATPRRAGTGRGRDPVGADGASSKRAGARRSRRRSRPSTCRCLRRPATPHAAARPWRGVHLAVGRVHDRSAAASPERPGERGRDPGQVARARAGVAAPPRRAPRRDRPGGASPRSWIRSSRWSRSSTSGWSGRRRPSPADAIRRRAPADIRRLPGARAHPRRRSPSASAPSAGPSGRAAFVRPWSSDRITPGRPGGPAAAGSLRRGRFGPPVARPPRASPCRARFAARADRARQPVRPDPVPLASITAADCRQPFEPSSRSDHGDAVVPSAWSEPGRWAPGIAQLALETGHDVRLHDVDETATSVAIERIRDGLAAGPRAWISMPMRSTTGSSRPAGTPASRARARR